MDGVSKESSADSSSPKPIYRTQTTGNYWTDVKEAFKLLTQADVPKFGEIPCVRGSLLNGIASGMGIGFIRAFSTSPLVACHWAMGTFMVISTGSWKICQNARENERRRMQQVVEEMPKRFAKRTEEAKGEESRTQS